MDTNKIPVNKDIVEVADYVKNILNEFANSIMQTAYENENKDSANNTDSTKK